MTENIKYMAFKCPRSSEIRQIVFREWFARTGNQYLTDHHSFAKVFFEWSNKSTYGILKKTINAICTYHIWVDRCNTKYDPDYIPSPTSILANTIQKEMESTIKSRINYLKTKERWWTLRSDAGVVSPAQATKMTNEIQLLNEFLSFILPNQFISLKYS